MIYKAIGIMSGSSLDGLDLACVNLMETAGRWTFEFQYTDCLPYSPEWVGRLENATRLSAREYLLLHSEYGHYIGRQVSAFIEKHGLAHQVALVASHGHTSFHLPALGMTAQIGDGAAIAAETGLPVVSDLRSLDLALGGQGAPLVPMGEKLLFADYSLFLNLGGIANVSLLIPPAVMAFDICPANRVLNLLAARLGQPFDPQGALARSGRLDAVLLQKIDALPFYRQPAPKSLANDFGTETVLPLLLQSSIPVVDALRTMVEHIAGQLALALAPRPGGETLAGKKMLVTGGGALNQFLVERIGERLSGLGITVEVPAVDLVQYKEALVMALLGVLRWREENTVLAAATGASRPSIGGAVWLGMQA